MQWWPSCSLHFPHAGLPGHVSAPYCCRCFTVALILWCPCFALWVGWTWSRLTLHYRIRGLSSGSSVWMQSYLWPQLMCLLSTSCCLSPPDLRGSGVLRAASCCRAELGGQWVRAQGGMTLLLCSSVCCLLVCFLMLALNWLITAAVVIVTFWAWNRRKTLFACYLFWGSSLSRDLFKGNAFGSVMIKSSEEGEAPMLASVWLESKSYPHKPRSLRLASSCCRL